MDVKPLALVVEDNDDQNMIFTKALELAGYQTESILDGDVAQKRLLEVIPEMIILDLNIPGVDGRSLLSQIRSDPRLNAARVILATADAAMAASLQPQADLVLLKPIPFTQMMQLAGRYLHHPRTEN